MRRMGGLEGLMAMLPGVGKAKRQMAGANIDERSLLRQEAIISSMTLKERRSVKILNGSRRRRIAAGAGVAARDHADGVHGGAMIAAAAGPTRAPRLRARRGRAGRR